MTGAAVDFRGVPRPKCFRKAKPAKSATQPTTSRIGWQTPFQIWQRQRETSYYQRRGTPFPSGDEPGRGLRVHGRL
jgi:hypothetical protein